VHKSTSAGRYSKPAYKVQPLAKQKKYAQQKIFVALAQRLGQITDTQSVGQSATQPRSEQMNNTKKIYEAAMEENCFVCVFSISNGFSVTIYDADADETVPTMRVFKQEEAAIAFAKSQAAR
jgi:hypothetical protein